MLTAEDSGSVSGQGTKIWRPVWHGQKGEVQEPGLSAEGIREGFLEEVALELSSKGQNLPEQNKISMFPQRSL